MPTSFHAVESKTRGVWEGGGGREERGRGREGKRRLLRLQLDYILRFHVILETLRRFPLEQEPRIRRSYKEERLLFSCKA